MNPATVPASPAIQMKDVFATAMHDSSLLVAEGVNWSAARGDYWVIAGPQRAGKTDFIMMAAGLSAPVGGEYVALDEAMPVFEENRLGERLRVGLVFEDGKLFNQLSVAENVALPLCFHEDLAFAEAWPRVEKMLGALELLPFAGQSPAGLSRNWQARTGLARALMLRPELMFLDNPLARLDGRGAAWWLDFLAALNRGHELAGSRPVTLVVTAEDFRPWKNHARQFATLRDRRLRVIGDAAALERCTELELRELL